MAYGNWDEIIAEYQEMFSKSPRTREHALEMLSLIPSIRNNPAFQTVIPITSHAKLFLEVPQKRTRIGVWYEKGVYTINLYDPSLSDAELTHYDSEVTSVDADQVILVLESYLRKVSTNERYP